MKGTISVFLPTVNSLVFYRSIVGLATVFLHTLPFVQSFAFVIYQRASSSLYSRCIIGCLLTTILSCFVFSGNSWAIDDESPELIMTGKQTHYKSTQTNDTATQSILAPTEANSRQFKAVRNSQQIASNVTKSSVLNQGRTVIRTNTAENVKKSGETNPMLAVEGNPVSSTNASSNNTSSTNASSNNSDSATAGLNTISPDNNGDIKNIRSPLRLRKHSGGRSSKSEFMRMCLINDCFTRESRQNFLVR